MYGDHLKNISLAFCLSACAFLHTSPCSIVSNIEELCYYYDYFKIFSFFIPICCRASADVGAGAGLTRLVYCYGNLYFSKQQTPLCGQNRLTRFHALISALLQGCTLLHCKSRKNKTDHDHSWALLRPECWAYFIKATYRRSQF